MGLSTCCFPTRVHHALRHGGLVTVKCLLPKAVYYEAENAINLKWFGSLAQASFLLAASVSL